jgi:CheY-like chemotaxis protein
MSELHVLVVDDEQDASEIIASLLAHYQVTTDRVESGEAAYDALMTTAYDAAIIDLFLADMDGIELIQAIRGNPEFVELPCIAVTAYNSSTIRKQAIEAGYNRYFAKPVNHAELAQGLRDLLA